jgi:endoplasmic reticulum-Golgi intermediate compartment protein 3
MSSSSGLRQRRRGNDDLDAGPVKKKAITLESFDLYQKVRTEEKTTTSHGGTVSVIALIVCLLLIAAELYSYLVPQQKEHMAVDPVVEDRMRINFDMTFHSLPCSEANIDAMDVAGEQQNGLDTNILKTRLDPQGKPIGTSYTLELEQARKAQAAAQAHPSPLPAGYCGSCYGADSAPNQCCNTCDEVRAAYADKGWDVASVTATSEQCIREHRNLNGPASHDISKPGEGCRLTGFMKVNKVAGNFHIAIGETHARGAGHIHQFNPSNLNKFNVTHTIHYLSFGDPYPGMKNPLDNAFKPVLEGTTGVWMYYIKVVPTVYDTTGEISAEFSLSAGQSGGGGSASSSASSASSAVAKHAVSTAKKNKDAAIKTNQYSVTSQYRPAFLLGQRMNVIPGVFFVYDISPFMVTVTRHSNSLGQLLTSLFAILGGVLTLAKVIDAGVTAVVNFLGGPRNVSELVEVLVARIATGNKNATSSSGKTLGQLLGAIGGGSGAGGLAGFGSAALAAFSQATSGAPAGTLKQGGRPPNLTTPSGYAGVGPSSSGAAAAPLYSGTAAPASSNAAMPAAAGDGWGSVPAAAPYQPQYQQQQQPAFSAPMAAPAPSVPYYSGTSSSSGGFHGVPGGGAAKKD